MSDDEVNDMTGMRIDKHSFDRMAVRLDDAERQRVIQAIANKWSRLENNTTKDFAIVAMDLGSIRMTDDTSWESNGDAVVGVVRAGTLKTVMLRRFNQPMTKEALRVDSVKWAIKPPQAARHQARKQRRRRNNRR